MSSATGNEKWNWNWVKVKGRRWDGLHIVPVARGAEVDGIWVAVGSVEAVGAKVGGESGLPAR